MRREEHLHLHVYITFPPAVERLLERVVFALEDNLKLGAMIMAALDDLEAEVSRQTTIEDSLLAIFDRLLAEKDNPARVVALVQQMRNSNARLSDAVTKGTPAEQIA